MYAFNYHKPENLTQVRMLLEQSSEPKLLAGGQTLLPTMKQRLAAPSDLIDLGGIAELKGINVTAHAVEIGAGVTHAEVASSPQVQRAIPGLAKLAEGIGDPHVRHMGTLGGSIANNDPAADYPGAVLGLGAKVYTNTRSIEADDFFTGMFETALGDNEIITRVSFPIPKRCAYAKFPNPASRYSMTGAFVAELQDGSVRVAITGAGATAFRVEAMETALSGNFSASALDGITVSSDGLNGDIHGSAEYRANLVGVMAKRAVAAAA